jgi:hypothetical protein
MNLRRDRQTNQGITLFEVVLVVLVLAFLAIMLAPMIAEPKLRFHPYICTNNIKQIALAYKIWAGDHNDKFPMELSVTNGGTMELMNTPDAWKTFQVMSNELCDPRIIFCPQDSQHSRATNFEDLKGKISYFIAASASEIDPQLFLSGDDDFLLNGSPLKSGPVTMKDADTLQWDANRHNRKIEIIKPSWFSKNEKFICGNVGLTDGSVQAFTSCELTNALHQAQYATNRLIIP